MTYRSFLWSFSAVLTLMGSAATSAAPVLFTLDPAQSQITLSGTVLGVPIKQQGDGSLTTHVSGTIVAELTDSTIQFPGGTVLDASTNGVWRPGVAGAAGSAPADFAAEVSTFLGTARGALRNLVLDMTSGVLPVQNGQFDASNLLFAFPKTSTASFDYDTGVLGAKGIALGGISTNKIVNGATLTNSAAGQTLSISVDTEFKFTAVLEGDSVIHLTGKLIATQLDLPSITSLELKDQKVILHVTGAGAAPRLDSSSDLKAWTTQTPELTGDATNAVLTLPVSGPEQYYRVAK